MAEKNELKEYMSIVFRGLIFTFGVFLLALNYNLFLLPNKIVLGGTSGLAIVFDTLLGIDPELFIYVSSGILLIISFIFLGFKVTKNTILGTLLYPLMITYTAPIATVISKHLVIEEMLLLVLISGVFYGISNGLIYKSGFTTGGSDVIMQLMSKYLKLPEGKANLISGVIIIAIGGIALGLIQVIYAVLITYISTILIDKILIGISESKVFYIYTKKSKEIKKLIIDDLKTGYTSFPTIGGYSHSKGEMIMCVVNTRDYYLVKEAVLNIDKDAFFVINDCYEVNGGVKKKNLPFI
ncbi:MAG: YitT family protein [Bacilli bacterium]|nr:YitT family protein [Bacilli bacterium]